MTATSALVELLPNRHQFGFKGKNAAYRAAALGEIPAIKVGGKWLVPLQAVEAMYQELGRRAAGRSAELARQKQEQISLNSPTALAPVE